MKSRSSGILQRSTSQQLSLPESGRAGDLPDFIESIKNRSAPARDYADYAGDLGTEIWGLGAGEK